MIWLFSPFLPKEAGEEVKKTIDSGFINRGKKAEEFEQKLREKFNFYQVHCVNSCTSALKLSLKVAGVKPGDEVISTPWTMIATNTAILECGAKPIFVDIKYDTLNLDPSKVEEKITDRTKAIMVVHYGGYAADLASLYKIAHKYNIHLIQDCAHALGSKYRGRYIGSFGKFCCFSFQAIKTMTTGDGGAISTTDEEVYREIVKLSWFGIDKKDRIKTPLGAFPKQITKLGYKHNITDIDATLGLVGLKHLNKALLKRQKIAQKYNKAFQEMNSIVLPKYEKNRVNSYWMYPMHVTSNRNDFARFMLENEIQVSKHNERNDRYLIFGGLNSALVNTERVDKDIIHIPIHADLTMKHVSYIIRIIKKWDRR